MKLNMIATEGSTQLTLRTVAVSILLVLLPYSTLGVCPHRRLRRSDPQRCEFEGRQYANGERINSGDFVMQCKISDTGYWKVEPSGCLTPAGDFKGDGERFRDKSGHWIKECRVGRTDSGYVSTATVGCVAQDGSEKGPGESWTDSDGFETTCLAEGPRTPKDNKPPATKSPPRCKYQGKAYNDGDKITVGEFVMQCEVTPGTRHWAVKPVGCLDSKGDFKGNGERYRDKTGLWVKECRVTSGDNSQVQTATVGCVDSDGKDRNAGESWVDLCGFTITCLGSSS